MSGSMVNLNPATTQTELLCPAGDWESLRAAVANGADAVYFGLTDFNARHRAANFTLEDLPKVMAYLHGHNVRGYVTCNTLIFSDELPRMVELLIALAKARVDAVIMQDLGLVRLAQRLAPNLIIHGSTQMTLTEPMGIDWVAKLGVRRVILARELSLKDIRLIRTGSSVPAEVFVHGALCVAYSGQCLTSESIGGRSANRGQCAQACRLPYELVVDGQTRDLGDKAYLLSPQDLAAHELIGELVQAGVSSLKIEGRLKSAQYVAAATRMYRAALDAALAGQTFAPDEQQRSDLAQSFSRGFAPGFLQGVNHQELVQGRFPKSRGVKIGTVQGRTEHGLIVQLEKPGPIDALIKPGDGVVFDQGHPEQDEQGGRVFATRPARLQARPTGRQTPQVELVFDAGTIQPQAVALGSLVWKTDDPATRRRLTQTYARDQVVRRRPIDATLLLDEQQHLVLTFTLVNGASKAQVRSAEPVEAARLHPLTVALAQEQFSRLGDTPFELLRVNLQQDGKAVDQLPVMAPKSVLNELRRQAVRQLLEMEAASQNIQITDPDALDHLRRDDKLELTEIAARIHTSDDSIKLHVLVRDLEQLQAVLAWAKEDRSQPTGKPKVHPGSITCDFEDPRKYKQALEMGHQHQQPITLATVRILKPGEEGLLKILGDMQPGGILVRQLGGLAYYLEHYPSLPLVGDYSLNVTNELTAAHFLVAGLQRLTPGYDLNWKQLQTLLGRVDASWFELVLHQHMPMFHMEHCVFAHTLSNGKDHHDCGRPCDRHRVHLRDRAGVEHPLLADVGCRNTLYNGVAQSAANYIPQALAAGLRHFRIELLTERESEVVPLLDNYVQTLQGNSPKRQLGNRLRVLQVMGVTPGTLAHA